MINLVTQLAHAIEENESLETKIDRLELEIENLKIGRDKRDELIRKIFSTISHIHPLSVKSWMAQHAQIDAQKGGK